MRPRLESLDEREVPATFGGVEFPQGTSSFADSVLFYRPVGTIEPQFRDSSLALGAPDKDTSSSQSNVSLGQGGELGLRFTDNVLTNSASADNDLWVFEAGPQLESMFISVRPTTATQAILNATLDADGFVAVGTLAGSTSGLDLDAVFPGRAAGTLKFNAVKIRDDPSQGGGGNQSPGADIDAVGAITSQAVVSSVQITALAPQAAEQGPTTATFRVSRTDPTDQPLTVQLGYGGTAINGIDYASMPTSVTFPANSSVVNLVLVPVDDTLVEGTETATLTITSAAGAAIDPAAASATAQVADNDVAAASVQITAVDPLATEQGPTTATFTVSRTGPTDQPLTVQLGYSGTAANGIDFASLPTAVTIPANSSSVNLVLVPVDDTLVEPTETGTLTITSAGGGTINPTASSATAKITDNDTASGSAPPTILALGASDGSVRLIDAATGNVLVANFRPLDVGTPYSGIVEVALGDMNGDGSADLLVAPASPLGSDGVDPGKAGRVFAYDGSKIASGFISTTPFRVFTPFTTTDGPAGSTAVYTNGLNIATGDVNGDGTIDLIAGTRGGSLGVGLREYGRATAVNGTDGKTLIGGIIKPFGNGYEKGVVVVAADLDRDGTAEVVVTRGGPVAATNPNKDIKIKGYQLKGAALTDLNLGTTAGGSAFGPFGGIVRDGRLTAVDVNKDGKQELVFTALDPSTPTTAPQQIRGVAYSVDAATGKVTTVSTGTGTATPGAFVIAGSVVDHAICDADANRDGVRDLAIVIQTADPAGSSVSFFDPVTGKALSGTGFKLAIRDGGVTLDGA